MHNARTWLSWAAALLTLTLIAGAAGARQDPQAGRLEQATQGGSRRPYAEGRQAAASAPEVPVIGPTSWSDSLDDAAGLSWLDGTQLLTGSVSLGRTEAVGEDVSSIVSLTEGPGGILYMGTSGARLWSYDPATGITLDLGTPVPDECFN